MLGRAIASVVLLSLMVSCSTSRKASEVSSARFQVSSNRESRDSLCEEISQNLNENLSEHEVVTWTIVRRLAQESGKQDTVKVERVTDRTKFRDYSYKLQDSRVEERTEVVRDTVLVKSEELKVNNSLNPHPSTLTHKSNSILLHLKWIFALVCAMIVLVIMIKVSKRKVL